MTDSATKTPDTVADDMRQRRTFYPTLNDAGEVEKTALESAQEYLAASMERFADFGEYDFAAPGITQTEDGDTVFDADIYNDSVGVIVGKLNGVLADGKTRGVKCLFMAPIPNIEGMAANASDSADMQKWLTGILEKEANHVAVRPLRDAQDVSTVVDQMPTTVDAYTTSGRGLGAGIMSTYNDLYKAINSTLSSKIPTWAKARLIKSELKRCMESAAYASEYKSALEDRGDNPSLFVTAINMGIGAAKRKGLDPTIFERWLATRDQKAFTPADDIDEDDLDIDSLTEELLGEDDDSAADTTDGADEDAAGTEES